MLTIKFIFPQEQDEWRDFEEEKKDYTGLKIGNLMIGSSESGGGAGGETNTEQNAPGDDTEGDSDRKTGPWKQRSEPPERKPEPPAPAAPVQSLRNVDSKGTYVSPGKLNQTNHLQPLRSSHRAKATAPDVHNEELFPSLSSSKADQRRWALGLCNRAPKHIFPFVSGPGTRALSR